MRIQIDLRSCNGASESLYAIRCAPLGEVMSEVFRLEIRDYHEDSSCSKGLAKMPASTGKCQLALRTRPALPARNKTACLGRRFALTLQG